VPERGDAAGRPGALPAAIPAGWLRAPCEEFGGIEVQKRMNQPRIKLLQSLIEKSEDIQFKTESPEIGELANLITEILQNLLRNEI
jgi:hypothetical protein